MLINATSSNIFEFNMFQSFGHHVARYCTMLDDVKRSLISMKRRLQHGQKYLLFLGMNNNVAFVWPLQLMLLSARIPTKLTSSRLRELLRECSS